MFARVISTVVASALLFLWGGGSTAAIMTFTGPPYNTDRPETLGKLHSEDGIFADAGSGYIRIDSARVQSLHDGYAKFICFEMDKVFNARRFYIYGKSLKYGICHADDSFLYETCTAVPYDNVSLGGSRNGK